MSEAQRVCPDEMATYRTSTTGLELCNVDHENGTILCDISTGMQKPVIPSTWQKIVFNTYLSLSHAAT